MITITYFVIGLIIWAIYSTAVGKLSGFALLIIPTWPVTIIRIFITFLATCIHIGPKFIKDYAEMWKAIPKALQGGPYDW